MNALKVIHFVPSHCLQFQNNFELLSKKKENLLDKPDMLDSFQLIFFMQGQSGQGGQGVGVGLRVMGSELPNGYTLYSLVIYLQLCRTARILQLRDSFSRFKLLIQFKGCDRMKPLLMGDSGCCLDVYKLLEFYDSLLVY